MRHLTRILLLSTVCWTGTVWATGDVLSPAVGHVTLTLGKAYISQGNSKSELVKVGTSVRVSDVIETASGGQVHIRFVDDALVSVRSSSTLEIVRYDYNAQNPKNSAVKLNLVEGVTRAISGKAAQNARQNFRLNTPIAAIGVRGTDFAVSADQDSVRAFVNEGLIVVAPFSSECSAESLGPCSQDAVELSGLSRQILEMNANTAGVSASLLPATNAQAQALAVEASTAEDSDTKSSKTSETKELYTDTVTSRAVNTTLATKPEPVKQETPATVAPAPIEVVTAKPEFTPDQAKSVDALTNNSQLVWGRWYEGNLDNERITIKWDVALENRVSTIGDTRHALFRAEPAGKSLQPGLGVLAFNLTMAQAQYNSGGKSELMDVNGGQLKLDFNENLFSTSLQLSHAATGNVTFEENGRIYSGAIFRAERADQFMAGTISFDGKEAGYFFQKNLENGSVEGLTLWNQKP